MAAKPKKKKNYVNNDEMYADLVAYKSRCAEAAAAGLSPPPASDYIGRCFIMIAENMARRPNWSGYSYKDEMTSDGIEDMISAVRKFDVDKYTKPFAYFSMICWNAFRNRIRKEKRQAYNKHRNFENVLMGADFNLYGSHSALRQHLEHSQDLVRAYDAKIIADREKKELERIVRSAEKLEKFTVEVDKDDDSV